jgi:hypothetical protein
MSMGDRGMENVVTDEGNNRGVHYSDCLGRDTKSMGDRGMESTVTYKGKDCGVHYSQVLLPTKGSIVAYTTLTA